MVLSNNTVNFYELNGTSDKKTRLTKEIALAYDPKPISDKKREVEVAAASRSTAFSRAYDMMGVQWTYKSANRTPNNSVTTAPAHLDYAPSSSGDTKNGIPYNWGGMNGVDTGTSGTYINFTSGISNGKYAGNISSTVTSSAVGVDCSGFVSAAYNFGTKYGTSTLNQVFTNTTWSSLVQGDIANKSGFHVWILDKFSKNSNGEIMSVSTYEATTDGTEDKAKSWARTWTDAQTYTPMTLK
ncbi:hypothetical protein BC351_38720 [Paenibacillus ferrarius]|uniref:Uncharacterized protein n=1 Tax=Paenibacillus ferrarius TaxID=1469647 RepID=A0A1V4H9N5_9BACL|nr:hypothetical protein [Paenibacillus ferrarius]OPH48114.1 hypothetical protein BC351_38720 [Paenibacillus ferrarius]